mgnify:CR=1 FL=1
MVVSNSACVPYTFGGRGFGATSGVRNIYSGMTVPGGRISFNHCRALNFSFSTNVNRNCISIVVIGEFRIEKKLWYTSVAVVVWVYSIWYFCGMFSVDVVCLWCACVDRILFTPRLSVIRAWYIAVIGCRFSWSLHRFSRVDDSSAKAAVPLIEFSRCRSKNVWNLVCTLVMLWIAFLGIKRRAAAHMSGTGLTTVYSGVIVSSMR